MGRSASDELKSVGGGGIDDLSVTPWGLQLFTTDEGASAPVDDDEGTRWLSQPVQEEG